MTTIITPPDDSTVPTITSTKGWRIEKRGAREARVYIATDGTEYVEAHTLERADLIRMFERDAFGQIRFAKWEGSSAQRAEGKVQRLAAGKSRRQRAHAK